MTIFLLIGYRWCRKKIFAIYLLEQVLITIIDEAFDQMPSLHEVRLKIGNIKHGMITFSSSIYYRYVLGVFLFFELTNKKSFVTCDKWFGEIEQQSGNPIVFSIGNKRCLVEDKTVLQEVALSFALKHHFQYLEFKQKCEYIIVDELGRSYFEHGFKISIIDECPAKLIQSPSE